MCSSSAPTLLMMLPPCLARAAKPESLGRETMQQETMAPKRQRKKDFRMLETASKVINRNLRVKGIYL